MPVYSHQGITPVVEPSTFLHPTAVLIGDVIIGPGCYIGPGASLRGDFGRIVIMGDTSVQDNCVLHTDTRQDCIVGRGSTIGHGAVLHGCVIGEDTLIGINAVVLDGARIGSECLVAALSLIRPDADIADRSLVAGNPGRVIRQFTGEEVRWRNRGDGEYNRLARESHHDLVACQPLTAVEPDRPRVRANATSVRVANGRTASPNQG